MQTLRPRILLLIVFSLMLPCSHLAASPSWWEQAPYDEGAYSYAVGCEQDEKSARSVALDKLSHRLNVRIESQIIRHWIESERLDATGRPRTSADEKLRKVTHLFSKAEFTDVRVVERHVGPDGQICVKLRVARGSPIEARLQSVAARLASTLPPDATILILPSFKQNTLTSVFGTHVSFLLGDALRTKRSDVREVKFDRSDGPDETLHGLVARQKPDALIYGVVDQHGDRVAVDFTALAAPELTEIIGSAHLDLRGISEATELLALHPTSLSQLVRPLMSHGDTSTEERIDVDVRLDPATPKACDRLVVSVRTDRPGWLTLIAIGPDGEAIQLLPDAHNAQVLTEPHIWRKLPDGRPSSWQVIRSPTPGPSRIMVVATHVDHGPRKFDVSHLAGSEPGAEARHTRFAITEAVEQLALDDVLWGSAEVVFDVESSNAYTLAEGCP